MTTNNHPAHGPVSIDRLHQIREILSKAAAQSDGGNLGYAMADAVKAIDELLAGRKSEPVAWTDEQELRDVEKDGLGYLFTVNPITPHADPRRVIKLYRHAQPEPVVPEAKCDDDGNTTSEFDHGWNACRAAMLQAKPSDDTRRMDWLVSKTVNVREPMVYGSHDLFWSQTISDDWEEEHKTTLREQIDTAMAAAPKVGE